MFTKNQSCRICGSSDLAEFLSLGDQPPANRFLKKEELDSPEPRCPLEVYLCNNCNLVQLLHVVDREELFRNYIYFSSGMPKLSDHFRLYAEDVRRRFLKPGDFVVEIASNDGILLKFFQDSGYKVLGVDPAVNVAKVAESLGIKTVVDFWSERLASQIVGDYGRARAILANNVVAHINDYHDLARGVEKLLDKEGVFIFEAPYLVDMFENLTYDTVYHEHLSYLAVRPLKVLFDGFGLEVFDVELHPVQGQSLRVFVGHKGEHSVSANVASYIDKELRLGLNKLESYKNLAANVEKSKFRLVNLLRALKKEGKKIAAYGAPAKGNTLLNYCRIGPDVLDYALEDLPSKQGLYTPGMHIPVVGRPHAEASPPHYYLLLAWNYADSVLKKEKEFSLKGGKFIIPVGDEIKIL